MDENLRDLPEDEMQGRSGHSGKGELYGKYKLAVRPTILPWLNAQLEKQQLIRVKNKGIAKELGIGYVNKSPTSIYWALKYVLFHENIVVGTRTHKDGTEVLTFRKRAKSDVLPDSLRKKELQYMRQQETGIIPKDEDENENENGNEVVKEAEFLDMPGSEAKGPEIEKQAELTTIELEQQQRAKEAEAKEAEAKEAEAKEAEAKEAEAKEAASEVKEPKRKGKRTKNE